VRGDPPLTAMDSRISLRAMSVFKTSRDFYLADVESTLFPLNTNSMLVDRYSNEIKSFLQEEVLTDDGGFQQQHRVYASKRGWYLRPTLKLDPVAEFFLYDFVYRNRALFRRPSAIKRRNLGFRIENGQAISALTSYSTYKKAIADYKRKYKHHMYLDVAAYFNHLYHHDLVGWIEGVGADKDDTKLFGRFLREIVGGRSIDCLPQGLYPAKMIGSSFLGFIETSSRVHSSQTLRLMDDVWLFDNDQNTLTSDFLRIQMLLSSRGLSINASKSEIATDEEDEVPSDIDEMKIRLLQRRREEVISDSNYSDASEEDDEELEDLTDEEQKYLIGLLDGANVQEEDAELVLSLMREHTSDVIGFLPSLISDFPNLTKRIYHFCREASDTEAITEILLGHLKSGAQVPEFQLFWFARMAESYLLKTPRVGDLLLGLYEHENATDISRAKVLEIPEKRFGLMDIREEQLRTGHSSWLAWTSAVGTRKQPKGQRNQMLKYFRKSSPMNRLIGEFVESCF